TGARSWPCCRRPRPTGAASKAWGRGSKNGWPRSRRWHPDRRRLPLSTLYVVATPIGNLEDVTLRALRILGEVGAIAAEDTRVTSRLLARHGLRKPMISYRAPVERRALGRVLEALEAGEVALVSDAGTPTLSDPG